MIIGMPARRRVIEAKSVRDAFAGQHQQGGFTVSSRECCQGRPSKGARDAGDAECGSQHRSRGKGELESHSLIEVRILEFPTIVRLS